MRFLYGFATFFVLACLSLFVPVEGVVTKEQASSELVDPKGNWVHVALNARGVWSFPVSLEDVDESYIRALYAYEDKRFNEHFGVDVVAAFRALLQLVQHKEVVSGASTITMQLARMLEPKPRTFWNKLLEMHRAVRLELQYSKPEILAQYLMRIPMGGNLEGVRAASYAYFGHSSKKLTWGEIALLIALPQSPEKRRPDRNPATAYAARDYVLSRFVTEGVITQQESNRASNEPIGNKKYRFPRHAYHYASQHLKSGQSVQVNIDRGLQSQVEQIVSEGSYKNRKRSYSVYVRDINSGKDLVYVGSSGILTDLGFNDMVRATRSPGSTLKPFIYALAYQNAIAYPKTIIRDEPLSIEGFSPGNYENRFNGDISVGNALKYSLNTPAVKLLDAVGVDEFMKFINNQNVELRLPESAKPNLSIALGGGGLSLEQLMTLYETLTPHHAYFSDTAKSMVYESLPHYKGYAYKTGTSYGHRDAWVVGYNQNYLIGVWTGRIDGVPIDGQSGLNDAVPMLRKVIQLLPKTQNDAFARTNYHLIDSLKRFDAQNNNAEAPTFFENGQTIFLKPGEGIPLHLNKKVLQSLRINGKQADLDTKDINKYYWYPKSEGFYEFEYLNTRPVTIRVKFIAT